MRAANQVPFHEHSAAQRKLCSPSEQMQTSAYFHQLIIHGSSDWSLAAGSTAIFPFFSFDSSSPEVLHFFSFISLNNRPIGNVATSVKWREPMAQKWPTWRHTTPMQRHSHEKKTLRGPEMTEVTCLRPKMAKKQMPVENALQRSHSTHPRRSQLWAPRQKCPHPFEMSLKQIWTYHSIALETLYLRSFGCNLISARGRPQICVKGAGVSVVVCLLLVFDWLAAERLVVWSWTQKVLKRSF